MAIIRSNSISGINSITAQASSLAFYDSAGSSLSLDTGNVDAEVITATSINATTGTFSGNLNVAGVLTYEDVTNVDSIGIVTARSGIHVTDGSVGIGTDSPSEKLHLNYNGNNGVTFRLENFEGATKIINDGGGIYIDSGEHIFRSANGSTERLRITSTGKVGVNQTVWTNKDHMFEVKQSTNDKEIARFTVDGGSGAVQGKGYIGLSAFLDTVYPHGWIGVEEDSGASYLGDLIFGTRGSASDSAPSERLRITSSGSVGIGTDNTNSKLHVAGSLTLEEASATGNAWTYYKNADRTWLVGVRGSSGDALSFYDLTSGTDTERMRIDSNGLIGINNESSPTAHLHIGSLLTGIGNTNIVRIDRDDGTLLYGIDYDSTGNEVVFKANTKNFVFNNGSSEAETFRITSGGAIEQNGTAGISYFKGSTEYIFGSNTSSPPSGGGEAILQIHQNKTRNTLNVSAYQNNAGGPILAMISSRSETVGTLGSVTINNDELGAIRFGADGGSSTSIVYGAIIKSLATANATSNGVAADLRFFTSPNNTGTGSLERLRITSGGYVNIGGNYSQTSYTAQVTRIGGNTDVMQIKGNTQNAFIRFTDDNASSDWTLGADDGSSAGAGAFILYDRNQSAYRMAVDSSGRLLIGTTTSYAYGKLTVQGGVATNAGNVDGLFVRGNGASTSCPIYFNSEFGYPQKSIYQESYYLKIRGHNNEGVWILGSNASTNPSVNYKFNGTNNGSQCFNASNSSTWNTTSDERIKENIQTLDNALEKINQIRPVSFDYTDEYAEHRSWNVCDDDGEKVGINDCLKCHNVGYIAQEYKEVFPNDVTVGPEDVGETHYEDFHQLQPDSIVPYLVKAVQELSAQNAALQARLDAAGL